MYSGPGMALRVMIAPRSAFVHIRDNDDKYFARSVGMLLLGCVLWGAAAGPDWLISFTAIHLFAVTAGATLVYLFGRRLGGNENWKMVFSVLFYAQAWLVPMAITFIVLGYANEDFTSVVLGYAHEYFAFMALGYAIEDSMLVLVAELNPDEITGDTVVTWQIGILVESVFSLWGLVLVTVAILAVYGRKYFGF